MTENSFDAEQMVKAGWGSSLKVSFNKRDVLLYALGIGCDDPKFVYENDSSFSTFPTYPVVLPFKSTSSDVVPFPPEHFMDSIHPALAQYPILDGQRKIEILKPLPTEGEFYTTSRTLGVHDKKVGCLVETEMLIKDAAGVPYTRILGGTMYMGLTGFRSIGASLLSKVDVPTDRKPDAVITETVPKNQAKLYRLSGDYNPLHIDGDVAQSMRFPSPVLHGLCSFGFAARHVLSAFGGNDPAKLKSFQVRFAGVVFPGETLVTEMWKCGSNNNKNSSSSSSITTVLFRTTVRERNKVVLANACAELTSSCLTSKL